MKRFFLLMAIIFLTSGCSLYQIESDSIIYTPHPKKETLNDIAYLENVNKPYEVIGQITVNAERNQRRANVIEKLKTEAAILGGDAITNIRTNTGTGQWAKIKPKKIFGNANIRINYVADVIVFKEEPVVTPTPPVTDSSTQSPEPAVQENLK